MPQRSQRPNCLGEASLAEDYFKLRVLDEKSQLERTTVIAYQLFLRITQTKYRGVDEARSALK